MKASILGGSGYIGGELLRLLLGHRHIQVMEVTSDSLAGRPVAAAHPNLRGVTDMTFTARDSLAACDVLFLATPNGYAMRHIQALRSIARTIIDLSADFRVQSPSNYEHYYGHEHHAPDVISEFVRGMPELDRSGLREADLIAVPGCMATPALLALYPFCSEKLLEGTVHIDARTGSSGSGAMNSPASHHPERSGAMRVFRPSGHRHEAEIQQLCKLPVIMSATGVEAVRGAQVVIRAQLRRPLKDTEVHKLFRDYYCKEPFVRIVKRRTGLYRSPEPKILSGTNYCDIGFDLPSGGSHIILIGAVDNLGKGGAGAAVQSANVRLGWGETTGLEFSGLHPI